MWKLNMGLTFEFLFGVLALSLFLGCPDNKNRIETSLASRNEAREAEVKSNIHTIQIALERYAVDTGGIYPPFLIGAEANDNLISTNIDPKYSESSKIHSGVTPFAKSPKGDPNKEYCMILKDPLIQYSYLSAYPGNPFTISDSGMWNSSFIAGAKLCGRFPFGGLHGDKMFDLGFGWGDSPQTDFIFANYKKEPESDAAELGDTSGTVFSDPDLDAPGNFYYHPVFADMMPVYLHYLSAYNQVYSGGRVDLGLSDEVVGYYLHGYGSLYDSNVKTDGIDLFNRMPANLPAKDNKFAAINKWLSDNPLISLAELDSSVGDVQLRVETTGYLASEYDPWTGNPPDSYISASNPIMWPSGRISGPDGTPDWVIIQVNGGDHITLPAYDNEFYWPEIPVADADKQP